MLRAVIISLTIILMRFSFSLKQTTGLSSLKLMRILKLSASNCDDFHHIWFRSRWKTEGKFYCNHNPFFLSFLFFFTVSCVLLLCYRGLTGWIISLLCAVRNRENSPSVFARVAWKFAWGGCMAGYWQGEGVICRMTFSGPDAQVCQRKTQASSVNPPPPHHALWPHNQTWSRLTQARCSHVKTPT